MSDVLVVGCGLLGTSLALALRDSDLGDVCLDDVDEEHLAIALSRGAGRRWDGERARIVVAAVPPSAVAPVLTELQRRDVGQTYTHLSSVQSHVQAEIEALSPDPSLVVGGHPMAGRELAGPAAAVADLFVGRPWAICPSSSAAPEAVQDVRVLAEACAAVPVEVDPDTHDRAVALLSHLPQVTSSALAAQLVGSRAASALPVVLAGPGLVDTTRLAAGDVGLWTDILTANAAHVAPLVRSLANALEELAGGLEEAAALEAGRVEGGRVDTASGTSLAGAGGRAAVRRLLELGNAGRATVPVKRGELAGAFGRVRVVLSDRPGELARLLLAAGAAQVNVEDVRVEHVPGRPTGVIDLLVDADARDRLTEVLSRDGWQLA